ncbi:MAG: hypothetical protein M3N29_09630 [Chloroflexota bacterium]|nr:hypothetical protein [Chloroflexota bacterium]
MQRIAVGITVALGLVAAALLSACGGVASPTPSPADLGGVLNALASRGATINQVVGGDAGCPDSTLHSNAARIGLRVDGRDYEIHLFRWRRAADFEAATAAFDECVAAYAAGTSSVSIEVVAVPPWRAFGSGWSRQVTETVREALQAAAAGG